MEAGVDCLVIQNLYFSSEKNSLASACGSVFQSGWCIAFQTLAGGAGAGAGAGVGAPLRTWRAGGDDPKRVFDTIGLDCSSLERVLKFC